MRGTHILSVIIQHCKPQFNIYGLWMLLPNISLSTAVLKIILMSIGSDCLNDCKLDFIKEPMAALDRIYRIVLSSSETN